MLDYLLGHVKEPAQDFLIGQAVQGPSKPV